MNIFSPGLQLLLLLMEIWSFIFWPFCLQFIFKALRMFIATGWLFLLGLYVNRVRIYMHILSSDWYFQVQTTGFLTTLLIYIFFLHKEKKRALKSTGDDRIKTPNHCTFTLFHFAHMSLWITIPILSPLILLIKTF